jgi:alpha-glucosidase (family GH31 glycosyl hydrolase)
MSARWDRRQVLKQLAAAAGALVLPRARATDVATLRVTGQECEAQLTSVSPRTVRLSILPFKRGEVGTIPSNGCLLQEQWGAPAATWRGEDARTIQCGELNVRISAVPLVFAFSTSKGEAVQQLSVDPQTGIVSFATGDSPIFGLGQGGPQLDRRGNTDAMLNGQGGYRLATHGARLPIPWLIGSAGWALFFNQPFGTFDFTGPQSRFRPANAANALPLDIFLVAARDPALIMSEYARLTGHAEMPPLWALGYQQSHRTLASREEVLQEAQTFRDKKLPCDALIYLGTGFCPSGWNTANGSFTWNSSVFPDPKEILVELREKHFRIALHVVILSDKLRGTVNEPCQLSRFDEEQASCYWDMHRGDFAMGVDGWWPDEGDPLDIASRLARNRMYWEGPQLDRPNERPYALHRNGYAGMQRYGSFLWSGDVYSTWETLRVQVSNAINTALSGIPYWGTDIGGFVPTKEFTAELYLRWFQFGAFCTLFRCHGRTWKLRLPWGWDTGDPGPVEVSNRDGTATPDASQLHNGKVEPVCRKYLELRYRMLPYLYSAVHECCTTAMPIMRALWLQYPDDPRAVACGDEYLWGKSLLVAPVVEKGAVNRRVYLPSGDWYDFWTGTRIEGGREIERAVDLETIPLYVRAGSILPLGPVKQYTGEKVDQPLEVMVYAGADASFLLYQDDGVSFNYRQGEWAGIRMLWSEGHRTLTLSLAAGSRMLPFVPRDIEVKLAQMSRSAVFEGAPIEISF